MGRRVYVIDGSVEYTSPTQIFKSGKFQEFIGDFLQDCRLSEKFKKFLSEIGANSCKDLNHSTKKLIEFFVFTLLETSVKIDNINEAEELIEELYNYWRDKHRFMVVKIPYRSDVRSVYYEYKLARASDDFAALLRSIYRELLFYISGRVGRVLRQLPSGVQAAFIVDDLEISKKLGFDFPIIWSAVLEPPVTFNTFSNKRKGIFPVKDKWILRNLQLDGLWYGLPIKVGNLRFLVYAKEKYLALLAGLLNLFKLGDFEEFHEIPDGFVFFGVNPGSVKEDEKNGVVYYDPEFERYVGLVPDLEENDYFGYMKKIILTIQNLIQMDAGNLPLHGAVARILLSDGSGRIVAFVGDSGAGKSETLEALRGLNDGRVKDIEIIADDMATLKIESGEVVAYGTEIGAFVRLDDIPRHYAYATMDRSIFMNPGIVNSRVIVPFANYEKIIKPWRINYIFYANNYTPVDNEQEALKIFQNVEEALKVFSEGKRMAKSTTHEKGLTSSYFANPFGAVQRRKLHERIAREFFTRMFENGVIVGEIRTQLGIPGMEEEGPKTAAKALLRFILS